jgi:DNA-binding NarL/FixJ family response regulator
MIRIMLVDDHTMVRDALQMVLEQDKTMQVVGAVGDGAAALRMADELAPAVVVMDVSMPGISGIETTRRLLARHPEIKVLALSTHLDRRIIQQMLDVGASGYIAKSAAGAELKQGIRNVIAGRSYLCSEVAGIIADGLREQHSAAGHAETRILSRREVQVATLLAEGKSAPEIADELHIASSTVDVHRRNLMRKLDLHNVVDLTRYAIRAGLVLP